MKQFNIKVAGRCATVNVDNPRFFIENPDDYPKISVYHCWNQMSSKKQCEFLLILLILRLLKEL